MLNPPVVAILLGTLVGMTPAGRALMAMAQAPEAAAAAGQAAAAAALPPELGLLQALARATLEVGRCWGRSWHGVGHWGATRC